MINRTKTPSAKYAFTLAMFAAGAIGLATALYASGQPAIPGMEFAKAVLCNGLGAVSALIVLAGALAGLADRAEG